VLTLKQGFPYLLGSSNPCPTAVLMEPSPLRSSKFSFEYLLLPPRSALRAVLPRLTPRLRHNAHALLLIKGLTFSTQWRSIGNTLKRHPFSGLVHSAGELLHTP
jgi:hypothetical protein